MRRGEAGSRINFEQLLIYLIDNCLRYENRIGFDGLCAVCEAQDETGGAEDYGALGTGVYDGDADWHAAGQRGADEGARRAGAGERGGEKGDGGRGETAVLDDARGGDGLQDGARSVCGVSREATKGIASGRGYCGIRARSKAQAQGGETTPTRGETQEGERTHTAVCQAHKYARQKGEGGGDGEERGCYGDGSEEGEVGEEYDGEEEDEM